MTQPREVGLRKLIGKLGTIFPYLGLRHAGDSPPKLSQNFVHQSTAQTFVKTKETDRKTPREKFSSTAGMKWEGRAFMTKLCIRTAYMTQQAIPSAALPLPWPCCTYQP